MKTYCDKIKKVLWEEMEALQPLISWKLDTTKNPEANVVLKIDETLIGYLYDYVKKKSDE